MADPARALSQLFGAEGQGKSWLRAYNRPNNGYSGQLQFDAMSLAVPKDARWKADQWICLTRVHAESCVALSSSFDLVGLLQRTRAPDELFFPTVLALLGELPKDEKALGSAGVSSSQGALSALAPNVLLRRLTFCDWSGNNPKSPADLILDAHTVAAAIAEGALFARKFKSARYEDWILLVGSSFASVPSDHEEEELKSDHLADGADYFSGRTQGYGRSRSRDRVSRRSRSRSREHDHRERYHRRSRSRSRDGEKRRGRY